MEHISLRQIIEHDTYLLLGIFPLLEMTSIPKFYMKSLKFDILSKLVGQLEANGR